MSTGPINHGYTPPPSPIWNIGAVSIKPTTIMSTNISARISEIDPVTGISSNDLLSFYVSNIINDSRFKYSIGNADIDDGSEALSSIENILSDVGSDHLYVILINIVSESSSYFALSNEKDGSFRIVAEPALSIFPSTGHTSTAEHRPGLGDICYIADGNVSIHYLIIHSAYDSLTPTSS